MCGKGTAFAMTAIIALTQSVRTLLASLCNDSRLVKSVFLALLCVFPVLGTIVSAQTTPITTISGTVYDPRTTASALPLPNVLVYVVTTGTTVPALTSGAQCLQISTPTGTVSYTTTAVDGTFTLTAVPQNTSYTLVLQAGN
jgi:hypothetical protein